MAILHDVHIGSAASVSIGDGVTIASRVTILDYDHGTAPGSVNQQSLVACPITIGKECWIGENVAILKGVTLGEGCIVGANAVVTKSFPAGSIIGGVPAKIIGHREGYAHVDHPVRVQVSAR